MGINSVKREEPENPSLEVKNNPSFLADMKDWISESAIFAWQYVWKPGTLGTPFVCSPFVAKEILKYIDSAQNGPPRQYLEGGPGTGAMTRHLIKKLRPIDTLHVVEIDKTLCDLLKTKFGHLSNVFIHHQAIQDWVQPTSHKFDAIISTIPLNSLPSEDALKNIFDAYLRLIKPEGILSSVEYAGISTICKLCFFGEAKKQLNLILGLKNEFFKKYSFERPIVMLNIPPARVTHCRISTST